MHVDEPAIAPKQGKTGPNRAETAGMAPGNVTDDSDELLPDSDKHRLM